MESDLITVARILRPRGLRGELVAELLTDFPDRFDELESVFVVNENNKSSVATIEDHWFQKNRVILKFKGIDSIEEADPLRNSMICIPESDAVELEEETYFDWDLEGCRVENLKGESLGEVSAVYRAGENINLVVQGEAKEYLIPFVFAITTDVDIENKLIKVDPPEGLLDF
ncbi:MAG: 16S rRNA processing protein RimM [Acidobacteria bacterium]|nr:16S rRNA processing protein RimM [Acidobacteriota bacterium]